MKSLAAPLLLLLSLALLATPAFAQNDLYDNGPSTLTADGWTINFGFAVSDSFVLASNNQIGGASFIYWLSPGDTTVTVDLSIGTDAFGSDIANFTGLVPNSQTDLGINQYGFDVREESYTVATSPLNAGTYWVTLQNAFVTSGSPVYWDENSGPSMAKENTIGSIPSESFTIFGGVDTGSPTPEPSGIILLGSGALGLAGLIHRKLARRV